MLRAHQYLPQLSLCHYREIGCCLALANNPEATTAIELIENNLQVPSSNPPALVPVSFVPFRRAHAFVHHAFVHCSLENVSTMSFVFQVFILFFQVELQ